ncbi:MAG: ABC transporter permease [Armatimonadota bacterium]|nr:ABC transporter permease [Armatimonadota bacterium]MDR7426249.1 ABC transporter permease [Armatimonadota bacterium]MDR7463290.1 ABC transporter permease [Armatimonadota bacterium]MDR7468974.1 ABC transporter permease [Armatimonadota bacterium]MDR7474021.1 ABC transporter permease [Armatimonadota bacterium]
MRMRRVWYALRGRAYPRTVGAAREPSWIFYDLALPILGVLAFVFVYRALGAPPQFTGYVIMGGATVSFWMNVMWNMAAQFYWEKHQGNLELYMMVPCGLVPILLGMAAGGMVATTVRAAVVVAVGVLLFRAPLAVSSWPLFGLIFALGLVALYGLGMFFSSLFLLWGREAWHLVGLLQEPVYLVSGFYFPVRALGPWVGLAASIIPITLALDGLRQVMFPTFHPGLLPLAWEIAGLALLAVLFVVLALRMLRLMERLARQEGRLSFRW